MNHDDKKDGNRRDVTLTIEIANMTREAAIELAAQASMIAVRVSAMHGLDTPRVALTTAACPCDGCKAGRAMRGEADSSEADHAPTSASKAN